MSDYCPARHDDTPGHACLCERPDRHEWGWRIVTHRCHTCGHEWREAS